MDLRALVMGLTFALIWSSAFTSARIIVEAAPPLYSLAARFLISGVIGISIALALGQRFNLTRNQWRAVIIFGLCQNAVYLGLNFVAMQWIEASLAAIIASTMPLLVALANWTVFKERLPAMGIFGMVAGFAGVAVIMAQRFGGGADPLGIALCLIAAVALAAATLTVKSASSDGGNLLMIVGLQMIVGAVALLFPAMALETLSIDWTLPFILAFIYTTLMPGLAATLIWFLLVGRIGPTRAATYHFLNPVFGVAIAFVFLSERLSWIDALGVAIIAGGILAVQRARIKA
ncbi:DMT family transporter [Gymnodinialimonas ceratoperidinii]|uniref:DMT family transporter n=1 Tax=Gymnodinialimonas ceratoperidinii TaxID=2856823 RepID=A0A8F6YB24_9RHOB|nr:DMT family transporter [Gymnodinialimonas ceratoperidinii]QXT40118.1 DMT family transporter [Gymnodinialimonas ceratoperidinii]